MVAARNTQVVQVRVSRLWGKKMADVKVDDTYRVSVRMCMCVYEVEKILIDWFLDLTYHIRWLGWRQDGNLVKNFCKVAIASCVAERSFFRSDDMLSDRRCDENCVHSLMRCSIESRILQDWQVGCNSRIRRYECVAKVLPSKVCEYRLPLCDWLVGMELIFWYLIWWHEVYRLLVYCPRRCATYVGWFFKLWEWYPWMEQDPHS